MAGAISVLVVDDEPLICWALTEALTCHGYEVTCASDARSAVELLTRSPQPVDVVLLDYHLPDANDLTPLATIRRVSPTSTVIMMTAFITPDAAAQALELGASRVLHKPIELDALASLMQKPLRDVHCNP